MDPSRPKGQISDVDLGDSAKRVEAAFLGSLCGCVLGKPIESCFTGHEIRSALEKIGDWPMSQYISKDIEKVLQPIQNNEADIVIGSRFLEKDSDVPSYRKIGIKRICN